jgi:hypothetical protein
MPSLCRSGSYMKSDQEFEIRGIPTSKKLEAPPKKWKEMALSGEIVSLKLLFLGAYFADGGRNKSCTIGEPLK